MILPKQRSSSIFCFQILFFFCGRFVNRPFLINKARPCHPERSAAKSNCEAAPSKARWDLGRNTLKFHYRSRFAPSLGSGSTTKISHREIFSAQDDTRYVNISGRGELRSPAGAPRRSPTGLCKHCALFRRDPAFRRFFAVSS